MLQNTSKPPVVSDRVEPQQKTPQPKKKRSGVRLLKNIVLLGLFSALAGGLVWSYMGYQDAREQVAFLSSSEGQAQFAQQEVDDLLVRVGQLILLPEDEDPLVATIQDIDALVQEAPFYLGANNGDKLIVYRNKALIYDPRADRLVNVGPVFISDQPLDSARDGQEQPLDSAQEQPFDAAQEQPFDAAQDRAEESQGEEEGVKEVLSGDGDESVSSE